MLLWLICYFYCVTRERNHLQKNVCLNSQLLQLLLLRFKESMFQLKLKKLSKLKYLQQIEPQKVSTPPSTFSLEKTVNGKKKKKKNFTFKTCKISSQKIKATQNPKTPCCGQFLLWYKFYSK